MQVCSYTYDCPQFSFAFTPKSEHQKSNALYSDDGLYAYFYIPGSEKFDIKIAYPKARYQEDIAQIQRSLLIKFILATLLLMSVALFFTFYSLRPIRKALRLNDEFIKDILHDFNTPISSIVLNIEMFKEEYADVPFVRRIARSIDTIMLLQNNLKSFLYHSPAQNQQVDIAKLAQERMEFMQTLYPKLTFHFELKRPLVITTNRELLTRIFDNLLSNAAKYNRSNGEVRLSVDAPYVRIEDTGKGIIDTQAVLQRYYTEQERGVGLGLHIVQKLTSQLHITMQISSTPQVGTTVTLQFPKERQGVRR